MASLHGRGMALQLAVDSPTYDATVADDVPYLEGRRVVINGFYVGIFNTEERFYAIEEVCPHMGGPLAERAEITDKNPPRLEKYDRWGHDISRVVMPPSLKACV